MGIYINLSSIVLSLYLKGINLHINPKLRKTLFTNALIFKYCIASLLQGKFSNVIERARSAEVALTILQKKVSFGRFPSKCLVEHRNPLCWN